MTSARFIWASSETSADLFYACRFFAPDPFGWFEFQGKTYLLVNNLEFSRAKATARANFISSIQEFSDPLRSNPSAPEWSQLPAGVSLTHAAIILWLRQCNAPRHLIVPHNFPLALARDLEKSGHRIKIPNGPFFPEREFKLQHEVEAIKRACAIAAAGIWRALDILRQSNAGPARNLLWKNRPLTSEILRAEIDSAVLRAGGEPGKTIVSCGLQACDPHERGSGPLHLSELIIIDVFPRDPATGFYGDITRTVVRGPASDAQRSLWQTCLDAQEMAIKQITPG
ncbi:MAG: M24 family metallopeptidase, partial [Chthoniobacterales bacterium]|nr:M24 family metallopeptidase [Chthoniobacterales bacterium]